MTKLGVILGVAIVAGVGTMLVLEHQTLGRLRGQNRALRQQAERLTRQVEERQRQSNLVAHAGDSGPQVRKQVQDLNRLAGKISALRQQTGEIAKVRAENRQLRSATDEPENPAEAEFNQQSQERANHLKQWGLSFILYARDHNEQLPATFEQAAGVQHLESLLDFATNNFEIIHHDPVNGVPVAGDTIVFREKQARLSPKGEWVKAYGLADGSVQIRTEPDGNFDAWEKPHLATPPSP